MADYKTIFVIRGDKALLGSDHNDAFKIEPGEAQAPDDDGASQYGGSTYGDHGTPAPDLIPPFILRITTDHLPQDKHAGFMIGRDKHKCDILLDDPRISEAHLAVQLMPDADSLVLRNHSQHGTQATFSMQNYSKLVRETFAVMRFETAEIAFGNNLRVQIQRFDVPANWDHYYAGYAGLDVDNPPNLAFLGLSTVVKTTNASKRPPVYVPDRRLGQGAFAQVFKAIERYTGEVYAMKLYNKPQEARWEEPEMLERLKHEHIVRYVAYIRLQGQPAQLIMEYVKGPNLEDYLDPENGYPPLDMADVRDILRQLLDAVSYLHGKKVVHRDIKPDNIVLTQRSPIHTKLVDFGLATGKKAFSTYCGTRFYLAPEVVRRQKSNTPPHESAQCPARDKPFPPVKAGIVNFDNSS
ncbi:hypothetical protein SCUCBS95973_007191 [Sporothrix curviconia]|uniref:non-specific serine/threonine protein kinase n=1 Tax=Sporothrix curviconia TaxID=1260050 RepID=A0ABP0CD26_9PEZI